MAFAVDDGATAKDNDASEIDAELPESKVEDRTSGDDSDSDDEDSKNRLSDVRTLLGKVLTRIRDGDLDLNDTKQYDNFALHDGKHLESLTGDKDLPTVLHILASMNEKDLPEFDSKMQPLIEFLAKNPDNLKVKSETPGFTSLFLAIDKKKGDMVQLMCSARGDIGDILAIADHRKMNCLHIAIKKRVSFICKLIDSADPHAFAAKDKDGNTPLHLAVEYKNCRRDQLDVVEQIIDKGDEAVRNADSSGEFNKKGLSPYLHHMESAKEAQAREKGTGEAAGRQQSSSQYRNSDMINKPRKDTGMSQKEAIPLLGAPPVLLGSDQRSHTDPRLRTQLDIRSKYGGGSPASAVALANSTELPAKPNSVDSDKKGEKRSGSKSKVDQVTVKSIERLLKLHYLRSRDHSEAKDILYGRNTPAEHQLFFDLSDTIDKGVITENGLDKLFSRLTFEDTLQNVRIPKINPQPSQSSEKARTNRRSAEAKSSHEGSTRNMCDIFDRLREKGVKTILRLIVDDSASPAHSDEAIEAALKDINVEIWDWQKTDLCTEVIYKTAPKAREVNLYWGGNNAVLRGWSEEGGLKKLRELKLVWIHHTHQGLDSPDRTKLNIDNFKDRMAKLCPRAKVNPISTQPRRRMGETQSPRVDDQEGYRTRDEWIQCMDDFRRLLFDAEKHYRGPGKVEDSISIKEPIQVALIDTGVDMTELECHVIGGQTYCPRDPDRNLHHPFYGSRDRHGTTMAKNIHYMCPQVQLYVLRIHDCPAEDPSSLNLTAKSAILAIRDAIQKRVHIISMSWSMLPPENDAERLDLENAILDANNAGILMFCSASDKGPKQTNTYPSKATNKIFTIGAANSSGATMAYVGNPANVDYTFPGDKVKVDGGPMGTTASELKDGSSVATALAAGLAALILYCAQVRVLLAPAQDKEKVQNQFQSLRTYDGMSSAFSAISTTEQSNHKFLKVWGVFGELVKLKDQKSHETWLELIADVGTRLCSKIF